MTAPLRIIYMGTPDFSVPALERLNAENDTKICLVVTQPDRPKGRGKKLSFSAVKTAAVRLGLDVFQPEKINTRESIERLSALRPDFLVVAAYGQILPERILTLPAFYPVNIHASLLPRYRGASPIQAAIANMDKETGVTTMAMAKKMDSGDIFQSSATAIDPEETAAQLHDRLAAMGADLIMETLRAIRDENCRPTPQDHGRATYVSLLKKSDGRIQWNREARAVKAHINAMTPWPGAFSSHAGQPFKIFSAGTDSNGVPHPPGTIFCCDSQGIHVACRDSVLVIKSLMGKSGKRLTAQDYLRGHRLNPPVLLE